MKISQTKNRNKIFKNSAIIKSVFGDNAFDIAQIAAEAITDCQECEYPVYEKYLNKVLEYENVIYSRLLDHARISFLRKQKRDNIGRKVFNYKYSPMPLRLRRRQKAEVIAILRERINLFVKDIESYVSERTGEVLVYYNGYVYSITRKCWIK